MTTTFHPAPDSATSEVRIETGELESLSGSPNTSGIGSLWRAWLLGNGVAESIGGTCITPAGWGSFDIIAEILNAGAGSGDIVLRVLHSQRDVGDDVTAGTNTGSELTFTAGAQNVLQEVTLASGVIANSDKRQMVRVDRRGHLAGDTLGNDLGVSAIILRRVS